MAGAKQHFIPRMLLRSFRMNAIGKVARVRVYRTDRSYTSPVEDVAAERFFSSEFAQDGTDTLDDVITRYETGLASDLVELNAAVGSVSAKTAARVVTHLLVRSDHVRGIMRAGASAIADLISDLFGSEEQVSSLLGVADLLPGPQFRKIFKENIENEPVIQAIGLPSEAMIPITHMVLRENASAAYSEMDIAVQQVVSRFNAHGPLEARDAHARALSSSLAPEARVENLEGFSWQVEQVVDEPLILPDFVALGWNHDGVSGSLLEHGKDELAVVMMPLSPQRALVGRLKGATANLATFNQTAIPHCLSFFVASAIDPSFELMAAEIGSGVATLLRESLDQSVASFLVGGTDPAAIRSDEPASWASEPLGEVTLHTDVMDHESGIRLNAIIGQILGAARLRFDIAPLRRIVINVDYEGALASLDRGRFTTIRPAPVASSTGLSVAYNVDVEDSGIDGVVLVLRDSVASGLLSDEHATFGWAVSVVLGQLARIGAMALINEVFEYGVVEGDQTDALLFPYSLPGWKTWLVAGYAGLLDPDLTGFHRGQFLQRLTTVNDDLSRIRQAYRIHGNIDDLLKTAGGVVSELFELACAAASRSPDDGDETLDALLKERGLANWFRLLRTDLPSIWREGTTYPSQAEMLVLNQHVRRLFLLGAIFFWDDNGASRVEVPYWSDIEWMQAQQEQDQ